MDARSGQCGTRSDETAAGRADRRAWRGGHSVAITVFCLAVACPGCGPSAGPPVSEAYGTLSVPELEARAESGNDARALRELAYRALDRGQTERALVCLDRAMRIEPASSDAYNIRGMAHASAGRADAAAADFKRAAELSPTRPGPSLNLGRLHMMQQDYPAAIEAFQEALRRDPANAEAATLAGDAWRLFGSPVAAKKHYRLALEREPRNAKAHAGLGEVLVTGGRFLEARGHLTRARDLGDRSARTRGYLGLACALSIQTPEDAERAVEHLLEARAAGESESHVYYGLGLAYLGKRDYAAAERAIRDGLKIYTEVSGLYFALAEMYVATGRVPDSRAARERSARLASALQLEQRFLDTISTNPKDPESYLRYANWLLARREYERAVSPLQQAVRLDARNAAAWRTLERVAKALSRPELLAGRGEVARPADK